MSEDTQEEEHIVFSNTPTSDMACSFMVHHMTDPQPSTLLMAVLWQLETAFPKKVADSIVIPALDCLNQLAEDPTNLAAVKYLAFNNVGDSTTSALHQYYLFNMLMETSLYTGIQLTPYFKAQPQHWVCVLSTLDGEVAEAQVIDLSRLPKESNRFYNLDDMKKGYITELDDASFATYRQMGWEDVMQACIASCENASKMPLYHVGGKFPSNKETPGTDEGWRIMDKEWLARGWYWSQHKEWLSDDQLDLVTKMLFVS